MVGSDLIFIYFSFTIEFSSGFSPVLFIFVGSCRIISLFYMKL